MEINKNPEIILYLIISVLQNCTFAKVTSEKCLEKIECDGGSKCYDVSEMCDKIPHCVDGSDEKNCSITCNYDEFDCERGSVGRLYLTATHDKNASSKTKKCVKLFNLCDGFKHCPSGSDEMNCSSCPKSHLNCDDDGRRCVPRYKICDQVRDCPNGKDELCKAKLTENPVHTIQICDGKPCQHFCHGNPFNTQLFNCSCKPSFKLQPDARSCVLKDEPSIMVMLTKSSGPMEESRSKHVKKLLEIGSYSKKVLKEIDIPFEKEFHAEGSSYDRKNNRIYLIDASCIYVYNVHNPESPSQVVNVSSHFKESIILQHLSFDWVHQNLYFCAKVDKKAIPINESEVILYQSIIGVVSLNGSEYRLASVSVLMSYVSSMLVDPRSSQRFLYFIGEIDQENVLFRCDLDGSNVKILVQLPLSDNVSLVLDTYRDYIYWIESHAIKALSLKNFQTTFYGKIKPSQTLLAVFDETFFLQENLNGNVLMKNFFMNSSTVVFDHVTEETFNFISMIHPFMQLSEKNNACENASRKCDHICVPKNKKNKPKLVETIERDSLKCFCYLLPAASSSYFILKHDRACELTNPPNETVVDYDETIVLDRFNHFEHGDQINSNVIDFDSVMGYAAKKNQDFELRPTTPLVYKLTITTFVLVAFIVLLIASVQLFNYWHKKAIVWAF